MDHALKSKCVGNFDVCPKKGNFERERRELNKV
jgi:hypothetical protein